MADPRFIPNSYQTPNILVDEIMPLLTPEEWVVLSFATRRILGWRDKIIDRKAPISLSQFELCGLSRKTIIAALEPLTHYRLLTKDGPATQDGQMWILCFDDIDIPGLKQRLEDKHTVNQSRTTTARYVRHTAITGGVSDTPAGSVSHTPIGGVSDTHNKHSIKHNETHIASASDAAQTDKDPITDSGVTNPAVSEDLESGKQAKQTRAARKPKAEPAPKSPITPELKDAIAKLCYGTTEAWKADKVAKMLGKALSELLVIEPALDVPKLRDFYRWWKRSDWRGQKGQNPEPHQVVLSWYLSLDNKETLEPTASFYNPPPADDPKLRTDVEFVL